MKKFVPHIYESDLYNNDNDFEDEESKEDYYTTNDFWGGSDFISFDDKTVSKDILVNCIDDEIIAIIPDERFVEPITNNEIITMLERFYNDDYGKYFTALMVGNDFDFRDDENYNKELPKIWYRGGKGMYYYCHQYNYKINFNQGNF